MYNLRGFSRTRTGMEKAQALEVWIKMCYGFAGFSFKHHNKYFFFQYIWNRIRGDLYPVGGGAPILRCIFLF